MSLSGIRLKGWLYTDAAGEHFTDVREDWYDRAGVETVTPLFTIPTDVLVASLREQAANLRESASYAERKEDMQNDLRRATALDRQADELQL